MSDFLHAHPYSSVALGAVVGFLIGMVIGIRHGDTIRATVAGIGNQYHGARYPRSVIWTVVSVWVALAFTVGYTSVTSSTENAKQNARLDDAVNRNTFLTNCTKEWAKSQGEAAKIVRKATVAREDADQAVKDAVIGHDGQDSPEAVAANEHLREVSRQLEKAREDNPPPEWESFCEPRGKR